MDYGDDSNDGEADMEIRLDEGNRCTVKAEPQQVILQFKLGTSTRVDMAITKDGARKLADALMSAIQ